MKDQPKPSCKTCRFWNRSFPVLPGSAGPAGYFGTKSFGACSNGNVFFLMKDAAKDGVFVDVVAQYGKDTADPIVFVGQDFGCVHYHCHPADAILSRARSVAAMIFRRKRSLWQRFLDWFAR